MNKAPLTIGTTSSDQLSSEVEQFCSLLARILTRCLKEQDPQVIAVLKESMASTEGVNHVAA